MEMLICHKCDIIYQAYEDACPLCASQRSINILRKTIEDKQSKINDLDYKVQHALKH